MQGERLLIRSREHVFSRYLWLKLVFTVGLYFFWWRSNVLELTDRRVVLRTGVLSRNERSVPLAKVQDVTVSRGPIGRLFGFGDLRIESAGVVNTEIAVEQFRKVERIKQEILRLVG